MQRWDGGRLELVGDEAHLLDGTLTDLLLIFLRRLLVVDGPKRLSVLGSSLHLWLWLCDRLRQLWRLRLFGKVSGNSDGVLDGRVLHGLVVTGPLVSLEVSHLKDNSVEHLLEKVLRRFFTFGNFTIVQH